MSAAVCPGTSSQPVITIRLHDESWILATFAADASTNVAAFRAWIKDTSRIGKGAVGTLGAV